MADYQQRATAHYNRKARPRSFKSGTLVLRKVFENTVETGARKFQANWEGPYIVSKTSESGAYHLQKLDGILLLRPWNVSNLKQYYQWKEIKSKQKGQRKCNVFVKSRTKCLYKYSCPIHSKTDSFPIGVSADSCPLNGPWQWCHLICVQLVSWFQSSDGSNQQNL